MELMSFGDRRRTVPGPIGKANLKGVSPLNEKIIRESKRGLTFSFPPMKALDIGGRYDYIIEEQCIRIVPADTGHYKVSRKRVRENHWNPLIDLRNKEILDSISKMGAIRLHITETEIIVSSAKSASKRKGVVLQLPRRLLVQCRKVAGISDAEAVSGLLEGVQLTLDDYLASLSSPLDIPAIHKDLPDVYTVVSLFSGAGVLDWPFFMDDRFDIKYAIDYDEGACKTYRQNIGMHITQGDIHKAFTEDGYPLDSTVRGPDVIIGGPSCKPFSNANRHTRLSDHKDSDLLVQYMRIVEKLRPKVWAMENVPTVLTACGGSYYEAIKSAASSAGYDICSTVVQDCKLGGFTTRRRAVIIGSRIGTPSFADIGIAGKYRSVKDALSPIDPSWPNYKDVSVSSADTMKRMSFVPQGGNYTSIPAEYQTDSKNRHSCTYRRLSLDEPAPTLVNWRKPPLIHPTKNRTLTVAEAKALQGLPKQFKVCGTLGQMQQQIGNCVPIAIGKYIKNTLLKLLNAFSVKERTDSSFVAAYT